MTKAASASSDFVEAAKAERDLLAARLTEAQEWVEHFETLAGEAADRFESRSDREAPVGGKNGVVGS